MDPIDLEPDSFVADYAGEPGHRTFFLQARAGERVHTYLLEKQQLAVLADKLREVLVLVDAADPILLATPARDPALKLDTPIEPDWRVGTIGLSYDDLGERVIVALQPVVEGDPEEIEAAVEEMEPDDFAVRLRVTRENVRIFILHALAVVAEGRPVCQLCGLPMDPEGHTCPASNGHRATV
jgi:uncharacterized repeat protein (TIGR03847 family)